MDGLQPWAKTELKRRGVQDLADAIAVAESLIDYTSRKESTPKPKDKRIGQAKGGGDKGQRKEAHQDDNPPRYKESSAWKGKAKAKDFRGSKKPPSNKCFICDGDHWVRECPQRQALNSLLAQHQGGDGDKGKEGAHMGSLQLLNVIQSAPKTETKGLIYVDVTINEKTTRAMLDTVRIKEGDEPKTTCVTSAGGTTRPIKARSASPAVGTSRPVLTVRRTGRPTPRSNYELFNCNNLNIRYWSWNYRGCWHQTCPPMDPR
ncbi:hypothetical protein V6N13_068159 [Hibiscus sabdariffa]